MVNPHKEPQKFMGTLVGGAILKQVIDIALDKALDKVVRSPSLPVEAKDTAPIKEVVRQEVLREVGPVIENMTNQEPLWRSKVLWTAVGSLFSSAAGMVDLYMDGQPDPLSAYYALGAVVITSLGTIYSRVFASKALGR